MLSAIDSEKANARRSGRSVIHRVRDVSFLGFHVFGIISPFPGIKKKKNHLGVPWWPSAQGFKIFFFVFFFFFCFFRAPPVAYGRSQARGPVGTVAASLRRSHSNAESKPCL